MSSWTILIVSAAIVILSLAIYAGILLIRLRKQQQTQKTAINDKDDATLNSIVLITEAMIQQQCDLSEGCWRLAVLVENLQHSLGEHTSQTHNEMYPAIFELYEKIKHMPIMEARKDLSKTERLNQDKERLTLEVKLKPSIENNIVTLNKDAKQLQQSII